MLRTPRTGSSLRPSRTILALVAVTTTLAAAGHASAAPAATVFTDPAGDTGGPDVTRVEVGNGAQAIVLAVRIANRTNGLQDLDTLTVYLDTDGNAGTGDQLRHGADRLVAVTGGATGPAALRARWVDGAWTLPAAHAGVSAEWLAPDVRVRAGLGALGDPDDLVRFSIVAVQDGINPDPNTDYAPDDPGSPYAYTIGSGPPPPAQPPPDTRIVAGPKGTTRARTATFRFRSTKPGSTFRCKLDRRPWHRCASPRTWRGLKPGWHIVRVAARDAAGRVDPTPAFRIWRIR